MSEAPALDATEPNPSRLRTRLGLLLRVRGRAVVNRVAQAVHDAPIRLVAAVLLIGLIWFGLYGLFRLVFVQLSRTPLEATVAIPLVFNFFFVAMLALLTFSNAIIAYGALFGKSESPYLLTLPIAPLDVVTLKYLECLALSSWSLILLGLPMMFAMAATSEEPIFYLFFLAFFLAFIPIPGAIGLLLAWGVARFFPRRATRAVTLLTAVGLTAVIVTGLRSLQIGETATEVWLRAFLTRMSFVQSALLPNNWVAAGIDHAVNGQFPVSFRYLGVTLANAFFLSWVGVRIVSGYFDTAYVRASAGPGGERRSAAEENSSRRTDRAGRAAVSPCRSVTVWPRRWRASANVAPVAPVLTLEIKRTESMGSRVAPEVMRIFIGAGGPPAPRRRWTPDRRAGPVRLRHRRGRRRSGRAPARPTTGVSGARRRWRDDPTCDRSSPGRATRVCPSIPTRGTGLRPDHRPGRRPTG